MVLNESDPSFLLICEALGLKKDGSVEVASVVSSAKWLREYHEGRVDDAHKALVIERSPSVFPGVLKIVWKAGVYVYGEANGPEILKAEWARCFVDFDPNLGYAYVYDLSGVERCKYNVFEDQAFSLGVGFAEIRGMHMPTEEYGFLKLTIVGVIA